MKHEPLPLEKLIQSVADGTPLDWDALTAQADAGEKKLLRHLRLVAGVAEVHRTAIEELPSTHGWSDRAEAPGTSVHWGHLVLMEKIGEGAFGEVYRARDPWLDRDVALKLLKPAVADRVSPSRIISEARALARLRHPNVVTVHGADTHDGRVGLWMEFVRGRTLAQILSQQGPFGASETAVMGQDVCRALGAVHAAGFVHQDVKAHNVMRESGGRLVLMDFGAGGTPLYMAPEVLAGGTPSVASDIYGLGVLLYHLVTGRYPVSGASLEQIEAAHAQQARVRLAEARADLPDAFVAVVERALSADPAQRFGSAAEVREALAPLATPAAVATSVVAPPRSRWSAPLALAATLLVAVAAASVWLWNARTGSATPIEVVAVLPFENVSEDHEEAYLATGVTMELTARLADVSALRVVPWTFTRRFESRTASLEDVVGLTGADAVVEGSVQVLPSRGWDAASRLVRIRVNVYRAGTGSLLWTDVFERGIEDLLALQSDIAQAIARQVNAVMARREALRAGQVRRVTAAAMEDYLKARELLEGRNDIRGALELFRSATQRDAMFAEAHTGLATCYMLEAAYLAAVPADVALARSLAAANRAIAIDSTMPEGFAARGFAHLALSWDWAAAEADLDRARALGPTSAAVHDSYSNYLTIRGRHDEAIAAARFAEERSPMSVAYARKVAWAMYMARRYDEAIAQLQKTLSIDSEYQPARTLLGRAYLLQGRYSAAMAEFVATGWTPMVIATHALAGQRDEAERLLGELSPRSNSQRPPTPYDMAMVHAALGSVNEALEQLELAYRTRDAALAHIAVDPLLDPLRTLPPFQDLVRRMSLGN